MVDLLLLLGWVEVNVFFCFVIVCFLFVVRVGLVFGDFGDVVRVLFIGMLVVEVLLVFEL